MSVGDLGQGEGMEAATGDYFKVRYPTDWRVEERYESSLNIGFYSEAKEEAALANAMQKGRKTAFSIRMKQ